MRVLIIDEDGGFQQRLSVKLKTKGYCVDNCENIRTVVEYISDTDYDCILMDLFYTDANGFYLIHKIREKNKTSPIIILSSNNKMEDKIKAFDSGINDYLVKPFEYEELFARIRSHTGNKREIEKSILKVNDLVINRSNKSVMRGCRKIELTVKEFAILEYLMLNQDKVLSKENILLHAWNYEYEGNSDIVKVYIRYLRKKIDDGYEEKLIHSVKNYGYTIKSQML